MIDIEIYNIVCRTTKNLQLFKTSTPHLVRVAKLQKRKGVKYRGNTWIRKSARLFLYDQILKSNLQRPTEIN